jgi:hypothetical protein
LHPEIATAYFLCGLRAVDVVDLSHDDINVQDVVVLPTPGGSDVCDLMAPTPIVPFHMNRAIRRTNTPIAY